MLTSLSLVILLALSSSAYLVVNLNISMGQMKDRFVDYQDPNTGFEIQYPIDWEKIQFAPGITQGSHNMIVNFLSPQGGLSQIFREYLLIESANVTSSTSNLTAFSKQELNFLAQSFPNFTPVRINASSSLGGHKAYSVAFTYKDPIVGVGKAMSIWTINSSSSSSKAYILSYHADSNNYNIYLPSIEKMIRSFKIMAK